MNNNPHSYFITIRTYGTRLHGQTNKTVDINHNTFGHAFAKEDHVRHYANKTRLRSKPFVLSGVERTIVLNAICSISQKKCWHLHAAHIRTNHAHIVISAVQSPEFVMQAIKEEATKALNRHNPSLNDRKKWARHGSTKYCWESIDTARVIEYTVFEQGRKMAHYIDPDYRVMTRADIY